MKFVKTTTDAEKDTVFVSFGEANPKYKSDTSFVVKEGESIQGVVASIKDSNTYKKIYVLEVKGQKKPLTILGKTDLIEQMGHSDTEVENPIEEGDFVRITFLKRTKTQKGRWYYSFLVEKGQA
jgi:hypothetical protein